MVGTVLCSSEPLSWAAPSMPQHPQPGARALGSAAQAVHSSAAVVPTSQGLAPLRHARLHNVGTQKSLCYFFRPICNPTHWIQTYRLPGSSGLALASSSSLLPYCMWYFFTFSQFVIPSRYSGKGHFPQLLSKVSPHRRSVLRMDANPEDGVLLLPGSFQACKPFMMMFASSLGIIVMSLGWSLTHDHMIRSSEQYTASAVEIPSSGEEFTRGLRWSSSPSCHMVSRPMFFSPDFFAMLGEGQLRLHRA